MTEAQAHYTTTEKELLAVVYAFEKFRSYLVLSQACVYRPVPAIKYLFAKKDAKPRLMRWILLLQEFDVIIRDKKEQEIGRQDHPLSRLENPQKDKLRTRKSQKTISSQNSLIVALRLIVPHGLQISQTTMRGISLSRECHPSRKTSFSKMSNTTSGMTLLFKICADQVIRRCVHGKEALDILEAAHMTHRGHTVKSSPPKRSLMPDSFGLQFIKMHTSWLKIATRANDKENFHKGMRCLKIPSKFVKSLTFGA
ncbi:reverse transcriptase domain-containing protein [Tanacetum coccineum]